jgi:hypothetical protein
MKSTSFEQVFFAIDPDDDRLLTEEDCGRPTREFEDDPNTIIIGLDTSRLPVRAIVTEIATGDGGRFLYPRGCATFEGLADFDHYWDHNWNFSGARVAVSDDQADPLGIKVWLEGEGYPLEQYSTVAYRGRLTGDPTLRDQGIDSEFDSAYALAICSFYRGNAAQVVNGIWVKLYEAEFLIRDLIREAHRLAAALASPTSYDEIPF